MSDIIINGLKFSETCAACPEQYEVTDGRSKQVGYLRLRHGRFTVEYPDCGGRLLLEAEPDGDGRFTDAEREHYLRLAALAVKAAIHREYREARA